MTKPINVKNKIDSQIIGFNEDISGKLEKYVDNSVWGILCTKLLLGFRRPLFNNLAAKVGEDMKEGLKWNIFIC